MSKPHPTVVVAGVNDNLAPKTLIMQYPKARPSGAVAMAMAINDLATDIDAIRMGRRSSPTSAMAEGNPTAEGDLQTATCQKTVGGEGCYKTP